MGARVPSGAGGGAVEVLGPEEGVAAAAAVGGAVGVEAAVVVGGALGASTGEGEGEGAGAVVSEGVGCGGVDGTVEETVSLAEAAGAAAGDGGEGGTRETSKKGEMFVLRAMKVAGAVERSIHLTSAVPAMRTCTLRGT